MSSIGNKQTELEETQYKLKLPNSNPVPQDNSQQAPISNQPQGSEPQSNAPEDLFKKEPFDAGVEANEQEDPKKFIQQLAGKLGQSLRDYTKQEGKPDFDLEKFAINSVVSATHTSEMDSEDKNDIIKKVEGAGKNDNPEPQPDNTEKQEPEVNQEEPVEEMIDLHEDDVVIDELVDDLMKMKEEPKQEKEIKSDRKYKPYRIKY